ncbi:3-hydroxybutyrate dehydrogenase [Brevundimonas sp. 2R-24]|uniref:3-hydroxybutyrate dehydrogenase n=1 Tax=Peiella sedimenti TaxID=3061083 RepID=A0ABT8SIH2_9CAUL|nr:3-hydroxybutyrate dehydrogenase [Caulobacteraceae bacterium XZ-24]
MLRKPFPESTGRLSMFQWLRKSQTPPPRPLPERAPHARPADAEELRGQVAVITGSTSGIGLAFARALAARGADVVLNGLGDPAEIERARAEIESGYGINARYHNADMRRGDEIADLVAFARHELGRLDILVNNAGIQHVEAVDKFPTDKWENIIAINLSAAFYAIRAAVPVMKAQGRGRIVNLASVHGLVASPYKSAYVAAKHGIIGLTKTVALEVAEHGVTCNAICPGYVWTPIVEKQLNDQMRTRGMGRDDVIKKVMLAAQPTRRFVTTDELSGMLAYLVSDAGASANGQAFVIDGGWTAA